NSSLERRPVQSTARPARMAGAVQKHAGTPDEAGGDGSLGVALEDALFFPALGAELPLLFGERLGCGGDPFSVGLVGEVSPVRTAALHQFGRGRSQNPLAPVGIDALPRAGEKRDV